MNRRNFIKSAGTAFAALVVGIRGKVKSSITTGVGRGPPRIFDNFGITIKADNSEFQKEMKRVVDAFNELPPLRGFWIDIPGPYKHMFISPPEIAEIVKPVYNEENNTLFDYPIIWTE